MISHGESRDNFECRLLLLEIFERDYPSWLDGAIEEANSSEEVRVSIDEVVQCAAALGVFESDLALDRAVKHAEEMADHEEAEASNQEDDRDLGGYTDSLESREVDEILDSLRE